MRLFHELRERSVFRVGAAYAIVAWIVMQAADILLGNFGAPPWVFQTLIVLLALGFPLALVLAWAFELTPEGLKRVAEVDPAATAPPPGVRRPVDYLLAAGLLVVIGFMAMDHLSPGVRPELGPDAPTTAGTPLGEPGDRSPSAIAVLPFENFSPDPNDAYFSDGITAELTSQLSRLPALRVIYREAVSQALATGASVAEVASQLGVGTLLDGSVRKDGDRVRITAGLVDPFTGVHLWSETYDRHLSDIFQIQQEVALAIVDALRAELTPEETAGLARAPTENLEAFELHLRSRDLSGSDPAQNRRAIELLREAVALDPEFAEAWSNLSWRYSWAGLVHGQESAADSALALARHAVELDPELPRAHYTLAMGHLTAERLAEAEAAMVRTLRLDPSYQSALLDGAIVASHRGEFAEAIRRVSAAFLLSPNLANTRFHVGANLAMLGDVPRLRAWLDRAAGDGMEHSRLDSLVMALLIWEGRNEDALTLAREGLLRWPENHEFESWIGANLLLLGAYDEAWPIIEERAREMPDALIWPPWDRTWRTYHAFLLQDAGEVDRASALLEESLRSSLEWLDGGSDRAGRALEIAAIQALRGSDEVALEWLERAYDRGYRAHGVLERDPMFASVREDPRFQALLQRMEGALARERSRAEQEGLFAVVDSVIAAEFSR
jgi:TolB-like protein